MKPIFLDRDGVINVFPGNGHYVTRVKNFRFLPGALDAIRILTQAGFTIFVISNQAGVGKGVFSEDKLLRITRKMMFGVKKAGGHIEGAFYCLHPSTVGCSCRKPEIGSILNALRSVKKTIQSARGSFFVGDTKSDILTGHRAGCKTILVLSGQATRALSRSWGVKPDFISKDLYSAVKIILQHSKKG